MSVCWWGKLGLGRLRCEAKVTRVTSQDLGQALKIPGILTHLLAYSVTFAVWSAGLLQDEKPSLRHMSSTDCTVCVRVCVCEREREGDVMWCDPAWAQNLHTKSLSFLFFSPWGGICQSLNLWLGLNFESSCLSRCPDYTPTYLDWLHPLRTQLSHQANCSQSYKWPSWTRLSHVASGNIKLCLQS